VFGAGLAQLHAHIDKTGCETQPIGLQHLRVAGRDHPADTSDFCPLDQQIADRIETARGIEQARASY
jgi:hypothetical protein